MLHIAQIPKELMKELFAQQKKVQLLSASLVQSGPRDEWWDCAIECYCHLRNVLGVMGDGKTAY